jgi:hypothetical protein
MLRHILLSKVYDPYKVLWNIYWIFLPLNGTEADKLKNKLIITRNKWLPQ